ncbi:DUF309 domain-containing protein [Paenibacillus sp. P96]|uniref:DUF309 domain-containing protein n=1 Tax=Paenibacillus zeirhizosphaerae TaxID=2987519 RepID=A0ABT9FSK3_9BACL|nr:DUF309 domain-containing protein [Paenibacillus sp. P96]MDP4097717.1 DUF309 domain-containing protein [Paenibacillus sp. P96]
MADNYPPLYIAYLVYFNRDRDYFECHEVLEELWLETGRNPLYKGLLQVAVGLFHFRNHNVRGASMMLESALHKLGDAEGDSLGMDLSQLVRETAQYTDRLAAYERDPFDFYDLTIRITDPELQREVDKAWALITPNIPQQTKRQRGAKHKERARILASRQQSSSERNE